MNNWKLCLRVFLLTALVAGCGRSAPTTSIDIGTTAFVELPESDPPVLTWAVVDRIKADMPQADAMAVIQDAAKNTPSAKASVDTSVMQSKLSSIRYDITLTQGKRKLEMHFKDLKLVDKQQEGIE